MPGSDHDSAMLSTTSSNVDAMIIDPEQPVPTKSKITSNASAASAEEQSHSSQEHREAKRELSTEVMDFARTSSKRCEPLKNLPVGQLTQSLDKGPWKGSRSQADYKRALMVIADKNFNMHDLPDPLEKSDRTPDDFL